MATCRHCYQSVMFKQDGSCPACGKQPDFGAPVDPDRALVVIGVDQPLPSCCILCGGDTERRQRMTFWYDVVESKTLLAKILSRVPGNERRRAHKVALPVCDGCAGQAGTLTPLSVRFGLDYRIVAHREFRARFEALNGPPQYEPT